MRDPKNAIITYTGTRFWPLDARTNEIFILDIAHALSNMCRFNGHVREFYSVAQHSVLVSQLLPQELKLAGLLHDATEAYLPDLSRPVKYQLEEFRKAEDRLHLVIASRFDIPFPLPKEVKAADNAVLLSEMNSLMPKTGPHFQALHTDGEQPAVSIINPLPPKQAEQLFMQTFDDLMGNGFPVPVRSCGCSEVSCNVNDSIIRIAEEMANAKEV